MAKSEHFGYTTVPPTSAVSPVATLADAFRLQWQRGQRPDLPTFLQQSAADLPADVQRELALRLIALDLEFRWQGVLPSADASDGVVEQPTITSPVRLEDYREVLAGVSEGEVRWPAELILHEVRLRQRCGDEIVPAEYLERFPHTPELHDLLFATRRLDTQPTSLNGPSTLAPLGDCLLGDINTATDRDDDYILVREVARGGMGIVYEARQLRLNRIVAVKKILDSRLGSSESRKRFLSEAQAAARLHHPNIVPVYEVGQLGGQPFFSMAYVEGKNLSAHIAKEGPWPPMAAAQLVRELAEAVQYAHEQGIVHRDLKPQNVLLNLARQPMITDFGLAKQVNSSDGLTLDGQIVGTPGYMAPEQARGQLAVVDGRADVYSLGAILYFVLTGRAPFHSSSPAETLRQLLEQEPAPPRRLNPEISADLETICLKCLQKEHARRYDSASALAADLERFASGFPILARPVSRGQRLWRACRRHPATALLATTIVLLLLVGVPAAVWYQGQLATSRAMAKAAEVDRLAAERDSRAAQRLAASTQQLADTHRYFANLREAQRLLSNRRLGWRRDALARLEQAASLHVSAADTAELRDGAAAALLGVDIEPAAELARGPQAAAIAFSHDGKWLATGQFKAHFHLSALGFECAVNVVDAATGKTIHTLQFAVAPLVRPASRDIVQDGCRVLQFSPDGRWLACGTRGGQIHLWDLQQTAPRSASWNAHASEIHSICFAADGAALFTAASDDRILKKWTRAASDEWEKEPATAQFTEAVAALYPDADGRRLLVRQQGDWIATVDAASLKVETNRQYAYDTIIAGTSWPGQMLIENNNDLCLLDLATDQRSRPFINVENGPQSLGHMSQIACSPDGAYALTLTRDDRKLRLWDMASRRQLSTLSLEGDVFNAAFAPDSRRIAVIGSNRVLVYRIAGGSQLRMPSQHYQEVSDFAWIEGEAQKPAGSGDFPLTALAASEPDSEPADAGMFAACAPVQTFEVSGDGRWAAVQSDQHQLALWRLDEDPPRRTLIDAPDLRGFRFSHDGQHLFGITDDSQIWMWDVATAQRKTWFDHSLGKIIAGRGDLTSLAPLGPKLLIGSGGGQVFVSDGDHEPEHHWKLDAGDVTSLAVSPDGAWALCGTVAGAVRLIETGDAAPPTPLASHEDEVLSTAFSHDGRWLASASRDRTVRLGRRDGNQVRPLVRLRFDGPVAQVQFHPKRAALAIRIQDETAVRVLSLDALNASLAELDLSWPQ